MTQKKARGQKEGVQSDAHLSRKSLKSMPDRLSDGMFSPAGCC